MPLPPIASNLTDRYWLKYMAGTVEHEMCFRLAAGTATATGQAHATALANALKGYITTVDSFVSLRYSAAGSQLSFPLAFTSVAGTNNGAWELDDKASFVALSGRGATGYRSRITFFTPYTSDVLGYRVGPATAGVFGAFYSAVTGLSPALVAPDGATMVWNAYVNTGWNSYWQRQLR